MTAMPFEKADYRIAFHRYYTSSLKTGNVGKILSGNASMHYIEAGITG